VDVSDVVSLLRHLFGAPGTLPCENADANAMVLDINGSAAVDIADPVALLSYLFGGGPPPDRGLECVRILGCPDACREP
jgi:hypothetical protein